MTLTEKERLSQFIAEEMRQSDRGSFPLSPGIMTGHYATARLYSYFRRDIFSTWSKSAIFGTENPSPPILQLPSGHISISMEGLNRTVWADFLETAFSQPDVEPLVEIRKLISTNAASDNSNFQKRLAGMKSQIVLSQAPTPSLLRSFMYEDSFPEKNEFFDWVFGQMRYEIKTAQQNNFSEEWSKSLQTLMTTWNTTCKSNPFISDTLPAQPFKAG